jgi:hypothetical protein
MKHQELFERIAARTLAMVLESASPRVRSQGIGILMQRSDSASLRRAPFLLSP